VVNRRVKISSAMSGSSAGEQARQGELAVQTSSSSKSTFAVSRGQISNLYIGTDSTRRQKQNLVRTD